MTGDQQLAFVVGAVFALVAAARGAFLLHPHIA